MATFKLDGTLTDFITNFLCPINLDRNKKYEAALISLENWNLISTITNKYNKFKYFNRLAWKIIELATGTYELKAINNEIQ